MSENNNNTQEENIYLNLKKVPLKSERKEKRGKILIALAFVLCLLIGVAIGYFVKNIIHPTNNADVNNTFGEIENYLENKWLYANEYDDLQQTLEDNAFYGMTDFDDDPYTTYMSKQELDSFATSINMDYVGIGVSYTMQGEACVTERVFLNSPAEKAGMQAGDIITYVDGTPITGLESSKIKELVLGEEGTVVTITIVRDGASLDLDIVRGQVDSSIFCFKKDNYLLMELVSFGTSTGKDIISYLDAYPDVKNIIIDLRDNSGGYQSSVSEIAGLFIGNNKTYLIQTNNKGNTTEAKTECSKTYEFDKIVLLVNENTASAAEVFAICLKEELPNVTVVGNTTFGKGVIQSTHMLASGAALKYTSYYWLSPNGTSINKVGIEPDEKVLLDDVYYENYVDMDENEVYELDSVSDVNRLVQLCLSYLDYDVDRTDGYFDQSLASAIIKFKNDNGLEANDKLDLTTYETIMSHTNYALAKGIKDYQMDKAVEIINK